MWGELASHKRLFNPPPQFSRLGTWCPALMSCMNVCEYVFMYVVCIYLVIGCWVIYSFFLSTNIFLWLVSMNNGFIISTTVTVVIANCS